MELFRGDAQRTGCYQDNGPRTRPRVLWKVDLSPAGEQSSPAVLDDKVICHSRYNRVVCVDLTSGAMLWERVFAHGEIYGSACVVGDMVYLGTNTAGLVALSLADGAERWATRGEPVRSAPLVVGASVIVGDISGQVMALDRESGEARWRVQGFRWIDGAVAGVEDIIVINDRVMTCGLSSKTGERLWERPETGTFCFAAPAISDGVVYCGGGSGVFFALSARTGEVQWQYTLRTASYSSPAVGGGVVYALDRSCTLVALRAADGAPLWSFDGRKEGQESFGHVTLAQDTVYVTSKRAIFALDAPSGALLWTRKLKGAGSSSSAVPRGGRLFVCAEDALWALK